MPLMRFSLTAWLGVLVLLLRGAPAWADEVPAWLPHYALDIHLDLAQHMAIVHERVTWTNRHARPAGELIFNAHSHFKLPDKDVGMTAKIVEILRMMPGETLDLEGHACQVQKVVLISPPSVRAAHEASGASTRLLRARLSERTGEGEREAPLHAPRELPVDGTELPFGYPDDSDTALVISLPKPVQQGESITIDVEFVMRLPQKQGRWGQWQSITFLSNWLPVLAYYDDKGWEPTPFIPWHQPFFNEAGVYDARITLPADQKVACTGTVLAERELGNGLRQLEVHCHAARDFAILCSACYQEFTGQAGDIRVRCLALPEHAHYAQVMVQAVCEAIPVYSRWFGPYPYPEFTIVESYFGWNGNECSQLVMIDSRIFDMPHVAEHFIVYLVSHECLHQWWYNVVGTHGYCETWMDEGLVVYFTHRLMNQKYGRNEQLIDYPKLLKILPNVRRDDYRYFGLYGTIGRGELGPTVQTMPGFGHIVNLFSMCYDKGSKIVGMIEDRLGEAAFFDFMRHIYSRYYFRILRVADFQRELEEYTGQSWDRFFKDWLYGAGLSDWKIDKVRIKRHGGWKARAAAVRARLDKMFTCREPIPCRVTVLLSQCGEIDEQTVLGFCLDGSDTFQIRVPIVPGVPVLELDEIHARVEVLDKHKVQVEIELPCRPTQIAVDPDQILVDRDPANNYWKPRVNVRFTPLYTFIDETDLTNAYDRWNIVYGPWMYSPTYDNPWFTRSTMFGARAGVYRTQWFEGGVYTAYRTNYRDVVVGADAVWPHWPNDHMEFGIIAERRLSGLLQGEERANRGVAYSRYIFDFGDSLYLPPFHYVEAFGTVTDNMLPVARETVPGAERFRHQALAGIHHHINYLTPYWDAEGGFQMDTSVLTGVQVPGVHEAVHGAHMITSQLAWVQSMPDGWGYLSDTRWAFRLFGAAGLPSNVEFFSMGGSELFRGFDLAQRQGSIVWVGSVEWRVPLLTHLNWNVCDRAVGLRNVYGALFSDTGATYARGQTVGNVAEALGVGLRLDMSWFTFVERTIFRFDMAKAINVNTPMQFWMGVEHPF